MNAPSTQSASPTEAEAAQPLVRLFLCGDVMTGRGIDQILPHPGNPRLHEPYVQSAARYVELAESASGDIAKPVDCAYVWGDALVELRRLAPHARIVNLETAVTTRDTCWPGKSVHYRMDPANVGCLQALEVDCCVLANNHTLDWGRTGLDETIRTLEDAGIRTAGAGRGAAAASTPAILELKTRARVLVHAYGLESSGIPASWRATRRRSGINLLDDLSTASLDVVARDVGRHKREGDIAIVSLHWGANWGFDIPDTDAHFARALIEHAGVDLVHGHSSHHVKAIEVHQDRLILYGCGDFLNDYEGISGYESYRGDLSLMYLPTLEARTGRLREMVLVPTRTHRLRVNRADPAQARWLLDTLNRESNPLGAALEHSADNVFRLRWS